MLVYFVCVLLLCSFLFSSLNNAGDICPLLCSVCVNNHVLDPVCKWEEGDVSKPGERKQWKWTEGTSRCSKLSSQVQLKSILTPMYGEGREGKRNHGLWDSRAAVKAPKCFVTDDFLPPRIPLLFSSQGRLQKRTHNSEPEIKLATASPLLQSCLLQFLSWSGAGRVGEISKRSRIVGANLGHPNLGRDCLCNASGFKCFLLWLWKWIRLKPLLNLSKF